MPIKILASHSWAYTEHQDALVQWLEGPLQDPAGLTGAPVKLVSIPEPASKFDAQGVARYDGRLAETIRTAHLLVTPIGMYSAHSRWITREISLARRAGAPILAVNPWGPLRSPSVVAASAAITVDWDRHAVRAAAWDLTEGAKAAAPRCAF